MIYNRFTIKIITRVLLITLTCFLFTWVIRQEHLIITRFAVVLFLIFQTYSLIFYINKTNRKLKFFLQSLRYMDSVNVSGENDRSFKELNLTYNKIIDEVRLAYLEKESLNHYLTNIVEHIGVGLISFTNLGEVEIINKATKNLLKIDYLKNIKFLDTIFDNFSDLLFNMKNNQRKLITIKIDDESLKIALHSTIFKIRGKEIKLISLQNIKSELEAGEIDAWQKLIRVLTHEIMNSITPISSLASTANNYLKNSSNDPTKLDPRDFEDIATAVKTIDKRSTGLLKFVRNYKKVYRVPKPNLQPITVIDLFNRIELLIEQQFKKNKISYSFKVEPESLKIRGDVVLLEQVIINLTKNSIEALEGNLNGKIQLVSKINQNNHPVIQIIDNGPGIPNDILQNIFIPFFTTKDEGSGIGLSLSRQIMRVHNGFLDVNSTPHKKTIFTLQF